MNSTDRIGESLPRFEDARLLRGAGRFVADIAVGGALHCAMVRSPHAHAHILAIDAASALQKEGVITVLTGQVMAADGVGEMRSLWKVGIEPRRFALARGIVRHVGEIVAVVVGTTRAAAIDGADLVEVDWETLDAVADVGNAAGAITPTLHEDAPGNICFVARRGNEAAVEAGLEAAAHTVSLSIRNNRLVGAAIEPRALLAVPDGDRVTLHATTQVPHHIRRLVAEQLGCGESAVRVVAPDVGGGFGYKGKHYPEETIVTWLARRLQRPIRWVATRAESFCSDYQGRDHLTDACLGLDRDGRFTALRVRTRANLGAYVSTFGSAIPSNIYAALLSGVYATPAVYVEVTGVFTNTVPTDAYRGAGRPEACFVLEQLANRAARELNLDPVEIRRRNLVTASQMPYATATGPTYDCGDFPHILESAVTNSLWESFPSRRAASSAKGLLRGIGIACYVESAGVGPSGFAGKAGARTGLYESATIRVEPDGGIQLLVGTHSHGQGHATTYAQILADSFGVPASCVTVLEGDTDQAPYGTGTFGSRSIAVGGSAIRKASDKVIEKATHVAAYMLDVAPEEVAFAEGYFGAKASNRRVSFKEVAHRACIPGDFPHDRLEPGLQATAVYDPPNFAFSNGAHVAEVEIDPETGDVRVDRYCTVDDIGTVINPMVAEGQVHGGITQGIGQALMELCVYDDTAQLVTGSFMDYALPRAHDVPMFVGAFDESQPCTHNPLGAKGCGEAGAIAAPAAVAGAVLDALYELGVDDLSMPFTAERIWHAMHAGKPAPREMMQAAREGGP